MKAKRLTAILTAVLLAAAALTGCGHDAGDGSGGNTSEGPGEEIYTVRVWGFGDANSEDLQEVSERVSEITREKIGVEVDLTRVNDSEKLGLALTSGEKLDLVCLHSAPSLNSLAASGRIIPLDDLLEQYGAGIVQIMSQQDINTGRINGKLYTVPSNNDNARAAGLIVRKDILDELQVNPEDITDYDKVHDLLVRVRETRPDIYPLVPTWAGGGMQEQLPIDNIDGDYCGVLEDYTTDSTIVVNYFETEGFRNFVKMMYQWNQEGLIMPDALTTTENALLGTVGFAQWDNCKPGKEVEAYKATGVECVAITLTPAGKFTSQVAGSSFAISAASERPEKAMELLNLMYTDPEVATLFADGIEGKHYVYADQEKNIIKCPDGVTPSSTGYSSRDWAWPNSMILPVWEGGDPEVWEQLTTFNDTSNPSPALGFTFDNTEVAGEVSACKNVIDKYVPALKWGSLEPEEGLAQLYKELEAAGIDSIIAEKQRQLDAWLSGKE